MSVFSILIRVLAFEGVMAGLLFGTAGRWQLPWFWALIAVHTVLLSAAVVMIGPDLRRERLRPGPGDRDHPLRRILLLTVVAHLVVAGLDARFHASGPVPPVLRVAALALYTGAMAWSVWAMSVNRFFSRVVRLQTDRGHHVVTAGPYRLVRHPGYLGLLTAAVAGGVVLGSWWSLVPLAPFVATVWYRTRLEDRFLHEALAGYVAYGMRVRYRLVPGVW